MCVYICVYIYMYMYIMRTQRVCFPTPRLFCTCQRILLGLALIYLIYLGSDLVFLQGFLLYLINLMPPYDTPLFVLVGIGHDTQSCHGPTLQPSGLRNSSLRSRTSFIGVRGCEDPTATKWGRDNFWCNARCQQEV